MLTERTIQAMFDVVKYSTRLKATLFEWDSARRRLIVTTSWRQKMYFILIAVYLLCEAIYQACTLYSESHKREMSLESYMKLVSHFVTRLCGFTLTVVNGYKAKSITAFFNQMVAMNRRFSAYFSRRKFNGKSDRALWFLKYFIYIQPLMPALTYVNEYQDKRYWQGAIFPGFIMPFIIPAFFVVEYWISHYAIAGPYFSMYVICSHCSSTPTWMTALNLKQKYVTIREWQRNRRRNGACLLYKGLQVLNELYNSCYANTLGVALALSMGCLSLMLALSIQLSPTTQFPGCLMFPIGVMGLIQAPRCAFAATVQVTETSMAFVQNYRHTRNRLQVKTARSLTPLYIRVSIFTSMSRSTMLEFYGQVINNTVSLLLM